MGTVRGNMGTVLEHAALVSAVQWAAKHAPGAKRPLRYIDTHAMAPLNEPHDRSFNWIGEFFEGERSILRSDRQRLPEYHRTLHAARLRWLDGDRQAYPTHFIQAALAAQAVGCDLDAWLFENDAAVEGRRQELEAFLSPESGPAQQRKAGLFPGFFSGALAPAPGDFRVPESWSQPVEDEARATIVFCDPNELRKECEDKPLSMDAADPGRRRARGRLHRQHQEPGREFAVDHAAGQLEHSQCPGCADRISGSRSRADRCRGVPADAAEPVPHRRPYGNDE